MSIVIYGLNMPKDPLKHLTVCIYADGAVTWFSEQVGIASQLPEKHGRLIDADAFRQMCIAATREAKPDFIRHEDWLKSCAVTTAFCRDIDEAPTIIEAEN